MDNNKYSDKIKTIYTVLYIFIFILVIAVLLNPYFVQTTNVIDFLKDSSYDHIPFGMRIAKIEKILSASFLNTAIFLKNIKCVTDTDSKLLISLYSIYMFYITIGHIVILFNRIYFIKSNNKLSRSIQYLIISISTLVLGIIIYFRGTLVDYEGMNYYYEHSCIPMLLGGTLVICDLPYLFLGIKEYKKNKILASNINYDIKGKFNSYLNDTQNLSFTIMVLLIPIIYILFFIKQGGVEFVDAIRIFK